MKTFITFHFLLVGFTLIMAQTSDNPFDAILMCGNQQLTYARATGISNEGICKDAPKYKMAGLYNDNNYIPFHQIITPNDPAITQCKTAFLALFTNNTTYTTMNEVVQDIPTSGYTVISNGFYYNANVEFICVIISCLYSDTSTVNAPLTAVLEN